MANKYELSAVMSLVGSNRLATRMQIDVSELKGQASPDIRISRKVAGKLDIIISEMSPRQIELVNATAEMLRSELSRKQYRLFVHSLGTADEADPKKFQKDMRAFMETDYDLAELQELWDVFRSYYDRM